MGSRQGLAVIVAVGVLSLGLGFFVGNSVSASAEPAAPPPPAEAAPPADTDVLRVTMAGDSVMAGLAPALEEALERTGGAEAEFILTPSILRDDSVRFTWQRELDAFDPDVIIMMVGTWELGEVSNGRGQSAVPGDVAWRETYDREILDPWIELLTRQGATVIWVGAPPVSSPEVNLLFAGLNAAYADLPNRSGSVVYVDSSAALADADGAFVAVTIGDDGPVRLRQIDGLHLCQEGAVRLAEEVLAAIEEVSGFEAFGDWAGGLWRYDPEYPDESCPAP